jgi:hypothetical protein
LKTAVQPGSTTGWGEGLVGDYKIATDGFFESLRSSSAFFALLAEGFSRVPLRQRLALSTISATAYLHSEGQVKPITEISTENSGGVTPVEAVAIIVVSNELLKLTSAAAQSMLSRELRGAVGDVVDAELVRIVAAAASGATSASSGTTLAACLADLKRMLGDVDIDSRSRLAWLGTASIAKSLALGLGEDTTQFPGMTPTGGTLLVAGKLGRIIKLSSSSVWPTNMTVLPSSQRQAST